MWKNIVQLGRPQMYLRYPACALHAGYLRLQKQSQNMHCLLLFHCNDGYTNSSQRYVNVHCLSCYSGQDNWARRWKKGLVTLH